MKDKIRKIAVIGTGFVGMSFAYAMLCDGGCDEMVLVDIDEKKAAGEAMDLNHGLAFAPARAQNDNKRESTKTTATSDARDLP